MAFQVKKTGSAEYGRYVKALVAGEPGSGKTRGARSWPNVFYISAEGGLMSIAADGIRFVELDSIGTLRDVLSALNQKPEVREKTFGGLVETVVIDTIDEIQRQLVRERLKTEKKEAMAQGDWGWLGDKLRAIVRGFRNLDMNVILNSHIKTITEEDTGKSFVKPQIQGAMGDEIAGYVDLALLLRATPVTRIEGGETVREIRRYYQTFPDAQHPWIKDRSGRLQQEMLLDFETEYQRFFEAIYGGLTLPESVNIESAPPEPPTPAEPVVVTAPVVKPSGITVPVPVEKLKDEGVAVPAPATDVEVSLEAVKDSFPGATEISEEAAAQQVADHQKKSEPVAPELSPAEKRAIKAERAREIAQVAAEKADSQLALAETTSSEATAERECTECGTEVDANQSDLSVMRHGVVLCRTHFNARKTRKK